MSELISVISNLRNNVDKLVATNKKIKEENLRLQKEVELMSNTVNYQHTKLEQLENKFKGREIKTNEPLSAKNTDVEGMKKRIDELVREIDKCITLINK